MNEKIVQRIAVIVMGLFPAIWGLLSASSTTPRISPARPTTPIRPMIDMADTYGNPLQTWRAITAPWAATVGLVVIVTVETLAGIFATIGLILMLRHVRGTPADFARGKAWMMLGAVMGILVWGVGFMVIAGDWFLTWQAKTDPLATQMGGLVYMLPCALALIVAMIHREEGA